MHGEHGLMMTRLAEIEGSSPYARGAHRMRQLRRVVGGIIPVCTGSTLVEMRRLFRGRDHPRMHGEHTTHYVVVPQELGSSPYARGALLTSTMCELVSGIIPVCTGSTIDGDGST